MTDICRPNIYQACYKLDRSLLRYISISRIYPQLRSKIRIYSVTIIRNIWDINAYEKRAWESCATVPLYLVVDK